MQSKETKHVFILNRPVLGKKIDQYWDQINEACQKAPVYYTTRRTENDEEIVKIVEEVEKSGTPAIFYAIGGDKMVHSLINKVDLDKYPVQIFPTKNENENKAYQFFYQNKSFDLDAAIKNSTTQKFDLGTANDEYFFKGVDIGFDVDLFKKDQHNPSFIKKLKNLYNLTFNESKREFFHITTPTADGNTKILNDVYVSTVNVQNFSDEGETKTNPTDGLMNIGIKRFKNAQEARYSWRRNKIFMCSPYTGQYKSAAVKEILIAARKRFNYLVDGELRRDDLLAIDTLHQKLTLKGTYDK